MAIELEKLKPAHPPVARSAAVDAAALAVQRAAGDALTAAGVPHVISSAGSMFSVFFVDPDVIGGQGVRDYATAATQDTRAYAAFFHSMLDDGVYLPPSAFEAWFLSAAHDDEAMNRIVEALPAAARAAARVRS